METETQLRLIVDTTPALIYSARPDGYLDFFNQQCLEFLGLPFEEISGWGWTKLLHPDDRGNFWPSGARHWKPANP